jgi:hypothetical protein
MSGIVSGSQIDNSGVVGRYPTGHVRQVVQGAISDSDVNTSATNTTGTIVASTTTATIENVQAGNNIWVTSNTPMRFYCNQGVYIHSNIWLYWHTTGGSYANVMGSGDGNTTSPYHLARYYIDENGDMPAGFYNDLMVPVNFMHKNVAAGTHNYKVYFHISGTGTVQTCWNELPGTMQLTEIEA